MQLFDFGIRVVAILPVVGVLAVAGCQPGEVDTKNGAITGAMAMGGKNGSGVMNSMGGMTSSMGGAGAPDMGGNRVVCKTWKTAAEIEEKLIVPRCGGGPKASNCHGGPYPPKIVMGTALTLAALDKPAALSCIGDRYIHKSDPSRSVMLTRSKPGAPSCATSTAKPDTMPPATEKNPLNQDEYDCLVWWAYEIAK